jgi:hypothetical protein
MDTNKRQIALSMLESLRDDLIYAHLNSGSRILDVADLRQYIYEQMNRIRTNALVMDGLFGNPNSHSCSRPGDGRPSALRQDAISTSDGPNGKAHH